MNKTMEERMERLHFTPEQKERARAIYREEQAKRAKARKAYLTEKPEGKAAARRRRQMERSK